MVDVCVLDYSNNHVFPPIPLFIIFLTFGLLVLLDRAQSSRPTDRNQIDHRPTDSKPPVGRVGLPTTLGCDNYGHGGYNGYKGCNNIENYDGYSGHNGRNNSHNGYYSQQSQRSRRL